MHSWAGTSKEASLAHLNAVAKVRCREGVLGAIATKIRRRIIRSATEDLHRSLQGGGLAVELLWGVTKIGVVGRFVFPTHLVFLGRRPSSSSSCHTRNASCIRRSPTAVQCHRQ